MRLRIKSSENSNRIESEFKANRAKIRIELDENLNRIEPLLSLIDITPGDIRS